MSDPFDRLSPLSPDPITEFIRRTGGPLHPHTTAAPGGGTLEYCGATLRDYFAAHAPVDFGCAVAAYGGEPVLTSDEGRAAFFAAWALLRHEYADAMLAARDT